MGSHFTTVGLNICIEKRKGLDLNIVFYLQCGTLFLQLEKCHYGNLISMLRSKPPEKLFSSDTQMVV